MNQGSGKDVIFFEVMLDVCRCLQEIQMIQNPNFCGRTSKQIQQISLLSPFIKLNAFNALDVSVRYCFPRDPETLSCCLGVLLLKVMHQTPFLAFSSQILFRFPSIFPRGFSILGIPQVISYTQTAGSTYCNRIQKDVNHNKIFKELLHFQILFV